MARGGNIESIKKERNLSKLSKNGVHCIAPRPPK